ncbi:MAG: MFS transporter [Bacilli bacterium]|nr:MFS transporter [Bacilli bacterium]
MQKVGIRNWLSLIIAGLVGQLAWAIENMFLNLYLFEQTQDASFVPWMVALSAASATVTTLLMGALSDKIGKRKAFISFGYIAWGISILLFAFITKNNVEKLFPSANAIFLTGVFIIILDCIMTFFGSTANDAAFNAFATDISTKETSNRIESVLAVLPLFAMLIIFGGFSGMAKGEGWMLFFIIFGVLTVIIGIISIFLFPADQALVASDESYFKKIFYGFKGKVIKENPLLYLTLLSFMLFGIAIQVFMPYFLIHIQNKLGFKDLNFTIIMGSVLLVASLITVLVGFFVLKKNKPIFSFIALGITAAGLLLMFFAKDMVFIIIAGIIFMSGNMIGSTILGAKVRDYTPRAEVGLFQGIRMIFVVLIPMIVGPFLGQLFYSQTAETYTNEYGNLVKLPNEYIYLGAMFVLLFAIIPLIFLMKSEVKEVKDEE